MPTEAPPILSEDIQTYGKKTKESNGIIAMMDSLVKDLNMEMTEAEVDENNVQEDYEEMMKDSVDHLMHAAMECPRAFCTLRTGALQLH